MDVFLVPVGPERYEPYCEVVDEPADAVDEPAPGFFRRMAHRFHEMIAEAELERRHGTPAGVPRSWFGRVRARTLRWVAESMAEQKLLWHLRKQSSACLHYPDDLREPAAAAIMTSQLTRDLKKHRRWLVTDSVLMVVFGVVLFAVPGPNIIGYYFAFRVVGHFLSYRGARQGLQAVNWTYAPSEPLTELRRLLTVEPNLREPRVHAVQETLRLEHLVSFFERTAVSA